MKRSLPLLFLFCCLTSSVRAEVRALWVVRDTLTSPERIDALVQRAADAGFDTLVVQIRGRGDAFYRSSIEPRSIQLQEQPESFDPLQYVLEKAHARGMKVHAWLNTFLLANLMELPASPNHVANKHRGWLAVPRQIAAKLYSINPDDPAYLAAIVAESKKHLDQLEGLYLSQAHPEVKQHLYNVWMDVIEKYPVDGVHFDYVRFPFPDFDYSRAALDRFRDELAPGLSAELKALLSKVVADDPLVYTKLYVERWDDFRRRQVTDSVERIYYGVKTKKPQVQVSAAVFADDEDAFQRRFQNWRKWLEMGILDVVCPMAYTPDTEIWKRQIASARGFSFGHAVWAGIGAYRMPAAGTLEKIELSRRMGTDGFILFSYDSLILQGELNPEGKNLEIIGAKIKK